MAHFINDQCTSCDLCRPECPTGSVFAGSRRYLIDSDSCNDCRLCVAVCPANAIEKLADPAISMREKNRGAGK